MHGVFSTALGGLLFWQAAGAADRPANDAQATSKALADGPWSEPLFNLRIRMAPEKGNDFRRGEKMSLLVEMQNVGDAPIKFADLHSSCRILVEDEKGEWLGFAFSDAAISPWEGSVGKLRPRETIRWTVWFDRLRLNKSATTSKIKVKISVPWQLEEPGKLPSTKYCPPVTLKLTNAPFTIDENPLKEKERPASDRWSETMELNYRQRGGLGAKSQAIRIDGQGNVTLLDCGTKERRATSKLSPERLDRLAAFLKQLKVWEAKNVRANGSEAHYNYFCFADGGRTIVGYFETRTTRELDANHVWLRLQSEMQAVIDEAVKQVGVAP